MRQHSNATRSPPDTYPQLFRTVQLERRSRRHFHADLAVIVHESCFYADNLGEATDFVLILMLWIGTSDVLTSGFLKQYSSRVIVSFKITEQLQTAAILKKKIKKTSHTLNMKPLPKPHQITQWLQYFISVLQYINIQQFYMHFKRCNREAFLTKQSACLNFSFEILYFMVSTLLQNLKAGIFCFMLKLRSLKYLFSCFLIFVPQEGCQFTTQCALLYLHQQSR